MKTTLLASLLLSILLSCFSSASPTLGRRTVTPANAKEHGISFSFNEYDDGRIYLKVHVEPEKVKHEIDAVGFAKLVTASYLDQKKTQLIAELGDKFEKDRHGNLAARVMLHRDSLANVKVWIEFGHGDGFIRFDARSFIEEWRANRPKD